MMKCKTILFLLLVLLCYTGTFGQYNFDSISVCHDKEKKLRQVNAGEYDVQIQNAKLVSFSTRDGVIRYDEEKRLFIITNKQKDSSFQLQLSAAGVSIKTSDTSFVVNTPRSIKFTSLDTIQPLYSVCIVGNLSFGFTFEFNRIKKVFFHTGSWNFSIDIARVQNVYTWDFGISGKNSLNLLLLSYVYNEPYLFSINDDANKVGVRLLAEKKNGAFSIIEGLKMYDGNKTYTDPSFKLKYTKDGRLRGKEISKFNLTCP